MSGQNGKGDTPRPKSVSTEQFSKNWNKIFSGKRSSNKKVENKCSKP